MGRSRLRIKALWYQIKQMGHLNHVEIFPQAKESRKMHLIYYDGVFGEQGSANAAIQLILRHR